jgi:hypothetical protein
MRTWLKYNLAVDGAKVNLDMASILTAVLSLSTAITKPHAGTLLQSQP